jgi:DNA repair exonuclease SbcCD nuclease subunit
MASIGDSIVIPARNCASPVVDQRGFHMEGVRFLHTSDWQLGMRRRFLGEEAARFLQARIDAVRTLARVAREESCAFAVVAGDVFESNQVDRRTVERALDALSEFPCPVFLLPANHDPLEAASIWRSRAFEERRPPQVRLLDGTAPILAVAGVEVVGVPWTSRRPLRDLVAEALSKLEPGPLRVMVAHGAVDALSPDRADPARISLDAVRAALSDRRIAYLALGDRHSVTEAAPRVWYSGACEPTDFDETAAGEALVVDLSADRCSVRRRGVGTWHFESVGREVNSLADVEALEADLEGRKGKERTILRLSLRGTLPLRARARLDAILEKAKARFASLELWGRHTDLAVEPDAQDLEALPLSGFARTALDALLRASRTGGAEAVPARDALSLLYRLAGGER